MLIIETENERPGIIALAPGVVIEDVANGRRWLEITEPPTAPIEQWEVDWETGEIVVAPMPMPPQWDALNAAILLDPDWQAATAIVRAINPGITEALPAAMTQISTEQTAMFAFLYGQICALAEVSQAHRETWATMAEGFSLPAEFVAIVRGAS